MERDLIGQVVFHSSIKKVLDSLSAWIQVFATVLQNFLHPSQPLVPVIAVAFTKGLAHPVPHTQDRNVVHIGKRPLIGSHRTKRLRIYINSIATSLEERQIASLPAP